MVTVIKVQTYIYIGVVCYWISREILLLKYKYKLNGSFLHLAVRLFKKKFSKRNRCMVWKLQKQT